MGTAEAIRDALNAILVAGDPQNSAGKSITHWLNAEPPQNRYRSFPFGFIQWNGGPVTSATMSTRNRVVDTFFIVVVDNHPDEGKTEDSLLSFYDSIEAVLDDDPTINGTVASSYVSNREVERNPNKYGMVALRLTLSCRKRE